jgi:membrane associated rhomboid family serine protease
MRLAFPPLTPAIKGLLIANVSIFVLTALLTNFGGSNFVWDTLALTPSEVFAGRIWQPFTYMWLHSVSGTGHLLGNMLFLYLFGAQFEQETSPRRTFQTFVLAGLGGAAAAVLVPALWHVLPVNVPVLDRSWSIPTVGASGAVGGIVAAWCGLYWGQKKSFFLVGSIPVAYFFYFLFGLQVLGALVSDGISSSCHIGGMLTGLALGRGNILTRVNVWWERRKLLGKKAKLEQELGRFEVIEGGRDKEDGGDDWIH